MAITGFRESKNNLEKKIEIFVTKQILNTNNTNPKTQNVQGNLQELEQLDFVQTADISK